MDFSFSFPRCKTCGEYIYKGKKFNARKETVQNEVYLGLPIFRFYIKCTRCLAEITFKVRYVLCFLLSCFPGRLYSLWMLLGADPIGKGCPSKDLSLSFLVSFSLSWQFVVLKCLTHPWVSCSSSSAGAEQKAVGDCLPCDVNEFGCSSGSGHRMAGAELPQYNDFTALFLL